MNNSHGTKGMMIYIVGLYLALTNCLYLVAGSRFNIRGLGKLYDVFFIVGVAIYLKRMNGKIIGEAPYKIPLRWYGVWMSYIAFAAFLALQYQSPYQSFRTIREMLLFLAVYFIAQADMDSDRILKILLLLDAFGSIIYIIQFITSTPIMAPMYVQQTIGSWKFFRSYAEMPFLAFFTIPYIIICKLSERRIWSKWKDMAIMFINIAALVMRIARSVWIGILIAFVLAVLFSESEKRGILGNLKKVLLILAGIVIIVYVVNRYFPAIAIQFERGITDIQDNSGNVGVRTEAFWERIEYLIDTGQIWFGMGAVNADMVIPGMSGYGSVVKIVDIAYASLFLRYGIIGCAIYFIFWFSTAVSAFRMSLKGRALSVYIIVQFWLATSSDALTEDSLLVLALLFGLICNDYVNRKEMEREKWKRNR